MMKLKYLAITTLILGGCTQEAEVSPEGGQLTSQDPVAGAPDSRVAAQHQDCTTSGLCLEGLTCLPRVGPFNQKISTCEIPCDGGCPSGQLCMDDDEWGAICWQAAESSLVVDEPLPGQGQPCPNRVCDRELTCVAYYGIAGPRGPLFTSCEKLCSDDSDCLSLQQRCVTIADGPGRVCRPPEG